LTFSKIKIMLICHIIINYSPSDSLVYSLPTYLLVSYVFLYVLLALRVFNGSCPIGLSIYNLVLNYLVVIIGIL